MSIRFVTIEGGEGCGKTSIIKLLCNDLNKAQIKNLPSREPGGSKISEEIRNVILNVKNTAMDYMTEALLYAASRRQHLEEIVKPAIHEGYLVICDRYIDSSLAYQGYARGLGIEKVYNINMYATGGFLPDLTILIDEPSEIGLARIQKNNRDMDRLDLEKKTFHENVRAGYLEVAKMFPERIVIVNGDDTLENVYNNIKKIIFERL